MPDYPDHTARFVSRIYPSLKFGFGNCPLAWYSGGAVPPTITRTCQKKLSLGGTAPPPYHSHQRNFPFERQIAAYPRKKPHRPMQAMRLLMYIKKDVSVLFRCILLIQKCPTYSSAAFSCSATSALMRCANSSIVMVACSPPPCLRMETSPSALSFSPTITM